MVTIKTTLRTISGPTSWPEVNTKLFQELIKNPDPVKRLSLLYDLDYDELMNEPEHHLLAPLMQASAFLDYELLDKDLPESGKIKIGAQYYDIPGLPSKDDPDKKPKLGAYTLGQAIQCRSHLEKCKTYEEGISLAVAIYMQPIVTKSEFTMEKVKSIEEMILVSPITEVLGTGFFLLQSVEKIWKQANDRMELIQIPGAEIDDTLAKSAGIGNLSKLADLSIIDQFAQVYHVDPDQVYVKTFDTVMWMMTLWKERERFQRTFNALKKTLKTAETT
jgi:hypothetical protein